MLHRARPLLLIPGPDEGGRQLRVQVVDQCSGRRPLIEHQRALVAKARHDPRVEPRIDGREQLEREIHGPRGQLGGVRIQPAGAAGLQSAVHHRRALAA